MLSDVAKRLLDGSARGTRRDAPVTGAVVTVAEDLVTRAGGLLAGRVSACGLVVARARDALVVDGDGELVAGEVAIMDGEGLFTTAGDVEGEVRVAVFLVAVKAIAHVDEAVGRLVLVTNGQKGLVILHQVVLGVVDVGLVALGRDNGAALLGGKAVAERLTHTVGVQANYSVLYVLLALDSGVVAAETIRTLQFRIVVTITVAVIVALHSLVVELDPVGSVGISAGHKVLLFSRFFT